MRTIEQAEADCRAAFASFPYVKGMPAWCCHHEQEFEALIEPASVRINYIKRSKPKHEQVVRFDNFRPMTGTAAKEAFKEYEKIERTAYAEYEKIKGTAWAEYEKIQGTAYAEYEKIQGTAAKLVSPYHDQEVPGHSWNGTSIFTKENK